MKTNSKTNSKRNRLFNAMDSHRGRIISVTTKHGKMTCRHMKSTPSYVHLNVVSSSDYHAGEQKIHRNSIIEAKINGSLHFA